MIWCWYAAKPMTSRAPWTDLLRRLGRRQRSCRFSMVYVTSICCLNGLVHRGCWVVSALFPRPWMSRRSCACSHSGPTATLYVHGELKLVRLRNVQRPSRRRCGTRASTVQVSNAVLLAEMYGKNGSCWRLSPGMTCLMRWCGPGDIVAAGAAGLTEALLEECRHIAASQDQVIRPEVLQRIRTLLTQANSTIMASMLRDLEQGARTEADHVLGDLLDRQSELAVNAPSLLRIAYLHLKTYEARRAREESPSASA